MNAELSLAFIVRIRLGSAFSVQPSAFTPMIPTFQPLKPRQYHTRSEAPAVPVPSGPVWVIEVRAVDEFTAEWEFSGPVTLLGDNVPELLIDASGGGYVGPDGVVQEDATTLCADYSSSPGVYGGDSWQILTQPANIEQEVEVPEREEVVG